MSKQNEQEVRAGNVTTWLDGFVRRDLKASAKKSERSMTKEAALRIEHSLDHFDFVPDPEIDFDKADYGSTD
ncbi:TraY domain-containing protein [Scandinavium goeteborgense]|uniref:Relaxosome protein TraY n=1 Tax=Scandinavium goeteborgense TaxID=1851514 RepID=A0A4R6E1E5_SCAGO|nr:TraY domain-containing protein [Scandinavium goeteborgense]TDN51503.1 TraY domain-containing protein [Scandinavium goeteborgense]